MNTIALLLMITIGNGLSAAVGCIDYSYHVMRERYFEGLDKSLQQSLIVYRDEKLYPQDSKQWHYTHCTCPCEQYRAWYVKKTTGAYGFCPVCKHRGTINRSSLQHKDTLLVPTYRLQQLSKNIQQRKSKKRSLAKHMRNAQTLA